MFQKLMERFGFGRTPDLQVKQSREYGAILQLGLDAPVWTDSDYAKLAHNGYQLNVDVFACVSLIIGAAKHIPWVVTAGQGGEFARPGTPGDRLLKLLQKPNERQNGSEFIEHALGYKLLSGNLYIERSGGNENEPPAYLYTPRPDRIVIVRGASIRNVVRGYRLKGVPLADGRDVDWEAWELLHLRSFNPLSDWYGMSPLEAAMRVVDVANESQTLHKRLLQKGYPPGAIVFEDGGMPETDVEIMRFKAGIQRARSNEEVLLLQKAKWQEMGFKPVDASIFQGMKVSKRSVAAAYRVPPEMIGDTELKAYASAREARRGLYTEAVIPAMLELRDGLNAWLAPSYGNAYIDIDRDAIDALQEDREVAAKRVSVLFREAELIKRNEARAELGYDAVPENEDGYYSEVVAKQAAPGAADGQVDPFAEADAEADTEGDRAEGVRGRSRDNVVRIRRRSGDDQLKAFNLISEEQKLSYFLKLDESREDWSERLQGEVSERFHTESNLVLKAYRDGGESAALSMVEKQEKEWLKLYRSMYFGVSEYFGRRVVQSLKSDGYDHMEVKFGEDVFTATILEWLKTQGAERVSGISDTTRDKIRKELATGVQAGESTFELSRRLQSMYSEFGKYRAERIARTEVISASNLGSQTAARSTNLPLEKEWISALDKRTRDPHATAHGQRRDMDKPYTVMGQSLMFPGDGSMGATGDNLIMCRCTESYRVKRG